MRDFLDWCRCGKEREGGSPRVDALASTKDADEN